MKRGREVEDRSRNVASMDMRGSRSKALNITCLLVFGFSPFVAFELVIFP